MAELPKKYKGDPADLFMKRVYSLQKSSVIIKKTLTGLLAGAFLFTSTISWGEEERLFSAGTGNGPPSSSPADNKLAPALRSKMNEFRVKFLAGEVLLSHKRNNEYIKKKIDEIGYEKLDKELATIKNVEGDVELIAIPGLLKFTSLPAHAGLGRHYGKPVIYIDSDLFYNEDIRQHEKDEVSGWETLRNLLGLEPGQMREWIMQNVEAPITDERLRDIGYYGKPSREIAEIIHHNSHRIPPNLHKQLAAFVDYEYLSVLTAYDDEATEYKKDVTIAARKQSKKDSPAIDQEEEEAVEDLDEYAVKAEINKMCAEYGFVPHDNPVFTYVLELLQRIYKDVPAEELPKIEILASRGEGVNSIAYANRTIIITPELLDFVEYEEELVFVLLHEMSHLDRKHFQNIKDKDRRETLRSMFGLARYQEYDADIAAFNLMESKGFNPSGGRLFFMRLKKEGESWGPVHGTETDRALNLITLTYLRDFRALGLGLNKMPPSLREAVRSFISEEGCRIERLAAYTTNIDMRVNLARHSNSYLAVKALNVITADTARYAREKRNLVKKRAVAKAVEGKLGDNILVLQALLSRIRYFMSGTALKHKDAALYAIVSLCESARLFTEDIELLELKKIGNEFASAVEKDPAGVIDDVRRLLTDNEILKDDIFNAKTLTVVLLNITDMALKRGAYLTKDGTDWKRYLKDNLAVIMIADAYAKKAEDRKFTRDKMWTEILFNGIIAIFEFERDNANASLRSLYKQAGVSGKENNLHIDKRVLEGLITYHNSAAHKDSHLAIDVDKVDKVYQIKDAGITRQVDQDEDVLVEELIAISNMGDYKSPVAVQKIVDMIKVNGFNKTLHALKIVSKHNPENAQEIIELIIMAHDARDWAHTFGKDTGEVLLDIICMIQLFGKNSDFVRNSIDDIFIDHLATIGKLPFDYLDKVDKILSDVKFAESRFKLKAEVHNGAIRANDLEHFRDWASYALSNAVSDIEDSDSYFKILEHYLASYSLPALEPYIYWQHENILEKGLKFMNTEKTNLPKSVLMKRILDLSFFARDVFAQTMIQGYTALEIVKMSTFEEALYFLENAYKAQKTSGFTKSWEYLIEEKAETPAHFEMLENKISTILNAENKKTVEGFGTDVGIDFFMERIYKEKSDLLQMLMSTHINESVFKEYLFSVWWPLEERNILLSGVPYTKKELQKWGRMDADNVFGAEEYYPLRYLLNLFYHMDYTARYILLRKLLTGEKGVLESQGGRNLFLDDFFKFYVKSNGTDSATIYFLKEVMGQILISARDDQLYFAIYPLLINRIAIPPEKSYPWIKLKDVKYVIDKHSKIEDRPGIKRKEIRDAVRRRLISHIYGYTPKKGADVSDTDEELLSYVPKEALIGQTEDISAIRLIREIAQKLGSPGVRFLQLLGQFVELPANYTEEFMEVYDSMVGQSRLTAYQTIKRESPEYFNKIKRLGKRIGGGSLMTVYEVELKDSSREAVKVVNPNAQYFNEESLELLGKVISALAKQNPRYAQALPLLNDLKEWLYRDLNDTTFYEDDERFRSSGNDGYRPEGFSYKIIVPLTYDTGSSRIVRERFIEGVNLTKILDDERIPAETKRELISLITRNYLSQIMGNEADNATGKKTLVHSDVHPGNFCVTENKEVAILDRSSFIKLTSEDRAMFVEFAFTQDKSERLELFLRYLSRREGNEAMRNDEVRHRLAEDILRSLPVETAGDIEKGIFDITTQLKQKGIKIPIHITLLLKNLYVLSKWAHKTGLESLADAAIYKPPATASAIMSSKISSKPSNNKGSPATLLDTIEKDAGLCTRALDKEKGVKVSEVAGLRPYHIDTLYKEFKILKALCVFIPVEGKRGYYRFSDMMLGPDENYTKTLINAINGMRYQVGKKGEERPLHRWSIPDDKVGVVRELVKMAILHQINLMQKPAIPENKILWHLLEQDIVSPSQQSSFAQEVNNAAEKSKAPERIYILKRGESIENAIAHIIKDHPDSIFDVALSDESHIENVPGDIKRLVFKGSPGDVAQLEGIIAALRALHGPQEDIIPTLERIYAVLKGTACQYKIPPDALDDPVKFAHSFIFDLPPVTPIPMNEIPKMNDRLLQLLIAA